MQKQAVCSCKHEGKANHTSQMSTKPAELRAVALVVLVFFGGIGYLALVGSNVVQSGPSLCLPCNTTSECGAALEFTTSPRLSLSARIYGPQASAIVTLQCREGVCVPNSLSSPKASCQTLGEYIPSGAEQLEESPSISGHGRKLLVDRVGITTKQRRLQRIRSDRFSEYFQARAFQAESGGGHGYLGINYSHDREE